MLIRSGVSTKRPRLTKLVAFDAHFDGAEGDFEDVFFHLALHDGQFVHGLEQNLIAGCDVAQQVGLGVLVTLVGAGAVGDDGLVKALLELAAQAVDAALGLF